MKTLAKSAVIATVAGMIVAGAQAQTSVTNNNSIITVNASSPLGMTAWSVGGTSILSQQSFYYQYGVNPGAPISSIPLSSVSSTGSTITTTYANSSFSLSIFYSLAGGSLSSGVSDISEQITIQSLNNTVLNGFRFYQFASFIGAGNVDLTQNPRNSLYTDAYVANSLMNVSESVDTGLTPGANLAETDANALMNAMGGANLDGSTTSTLGLWALQWNENIAAGGTVIISKDLNAMVPVPEPSTWALFSLGLGVVALQVYRRRAVKVLAPVKIK